MGLDNKEVFARRGGTGGSNEPYELMTHGRKRLEVPADQPGLKFEKADATPVSPTDPGTGIVFFRDAGGGVTQACLRFPSGAVQIIATESA